MGDGESLCLELLANPETGERILDVVMVSSRPLSPEALRAAAERTLEGWRASERAAVFVARREHAAAVEEYRKALALLPSDAGLHNRLGVVYQHMGKDELARHEYERTVALNPWLLSPAAFVIAIVLAFNFIGDGLRDAADPYKS